jgi:hypothetical protein
VLKVKDSALNSPNEAGVSITNNAGTYGTFNFKTGAHNNVEVLTSAPGQNIRAGIHSHGKGGGDTAANSPSPADLFHLLEGHQFNANYLADFVFSHDSTEWALMISDTSLASIFLSTFSRDSTLMGADWDTTKLDPGTGFKVKDLYWGLMKDLYEKGHYPIEHVQGYANAALFSIFLKPGVTMCRRENGQFKELSTAIKTNPDGTYSVIIKICL